MVQMHHAAATAGRGMLWPMTTAPALATPASDPRAISAVLLDVHRAGQELPLARFQDEALALVRRLIPFRFARTHLFNACSQMIVWAHTK